MQTKRIALKSTLATLATAAIAVGIAHVYPAQAAPGGNSGPKPVDVNVANAPLPVIGDVSVSGVTAALPTLPDSPFFADLFVTNADKVAGVDGTSLLGITSITVTNFDSATQQVKIFAPVVDGSSCGAATVTGGSSPSFNVLVEGRRTLHLDFPTPMVFQPIAGLTCVAATITTTHTNGVAVTLNGYSQLL